MKICSFNLPVRRYGVSVCRAVLQDLYRLTSTLANFLNFPQHAYSAVYINKPTDKTNKQNQTKTYPPWRRWQKRSGKNIAKYRGPIEISGLRNFSLDCSAFNNHFYVCHSLAIVYSVAARGCSPPGANVCVAAPAIQISSAIREFFRILDMGVRTNPWDPLLFRPALFSPLPSLPCKLPQRGLGWSPSRNWIWYILALKSDIRWQQI